MKFRSSAPANLIACIPFGKIQQIVSCLELQVDGEDLPLGPSGRWVAVLAMPIDTAEESICSL